jgi:SAM-dependent methyltransferase
MRKPKASPPYSVLGRFYDQVTRDSPEMNRHARRKILGRLLPRLKAVCDLGCGTGTTAVELARAGHKVYAVDASPVQCGQAREKARRAGVAVRVICADMRRFRLPEPVDLVLCEFNPLNHLPRKSDLNVALAMVARALRPGGWFYFDLNMRPTYARLYPTTRFEEHDGFCLISRGVFDKRRERAWMDLDWFVASPLTFRASLREAGRASPVRNVKGWRRYRERIVDTWWSDAEIRRALRRAGFGKIRAWDGARIRPRKMKPRRGFDRYYLAKRLSAQA